MKLYCCSQVIVEVVIDKNNLNSEMIPASESQFCLSALSLGAESACFCTCFSVINTIFNKIVDGVVYRSIYIHISLLYLWKNKIKPL